MWAPYRLSDGNAAAFGVGWTVGTVGGRTCVGHSGGPALADILYFPAERLGLVVLTNQQRLHPSLARGLAARLLPPGPLGMAAVPPDPAPALTARHRALVADLMAGKPDRGAYAGEAASALGDSLPWLESQVGCYPPPLERFQFLGSRTEGVRTIRDYRAHHGGAAALGGRLILESGRVVDYEPAEA